MAKATALAAQRLAHLRAAPLSRLGVGTYRLTESNPVHRRALARSLELGASVVDTSPNYSDGGAERLVGSVLKDSGTVRDDIHLISKCGYQAVGRTGSDPEDPPAPAAPAAAAAAAADDDDADDADDATAPPIPPTAGPKPPPEGVEVMPGVFQSIHPDFIRQQLGESLDRLGVTHLDTYLLHNPEHYLIASIPVQTGGAEGEGGGEVVSLKFSSFD